MKKSVNILFSSVLVISLFILLLVLCSCNTSSDGVCARVNDAEIMEEQITEYISNFRRANQLERDDDWKNYLKQENKNPKEIRNETIDIFIDAAIKNDLAKKFNVVPSQEEIDKQISTNKKYFNTEEEFNNFIKQNFSNYDYFVKSTTIDITSSKVDNELVKKADVDDVVSNKFFLTNSNKINGSRGYYQLQFKNDNIASAQEYLRQINSGEISFEDATKKLKNEDTEKLNFDYVIYDFLIQNPQKLTDTINSMQLGQVSGLVECENYTFIVKLVDIVSCQNDILSFDDLPKFTSDNLKAYSKIVYSQDILSKEYDKEKSNFKITKYDPPNDLPYF